MATTINTVTGPISSDDLGKTLVHEHFAVGLPGFQGDTLGPYDRKAVVRTGPNVSERVEAHGVKTIIEIVSGSCGLSKEGDNWHRPLTEIEAEDNLCPA